MHGINPARTYTYLIEEIPARAGIFHLAKCDPSLIMGKGQPRWLASACHLRQQFRIVRSLETGPRDGENSDCNLAHADNGAQGRKLVNTLRSRQLERPINNKRFEFFVIGQGDCNCVFYCVATLLC